MSSRNNEAQERLLQQTPSSETEILLMLLQGGTGTTFASNNNGWDQQTPVCDWKGIACDGDGEIVEINLADGGLEGTLPSWLGHITTLLDLYMGSNAYSGAVPPEIQSLPRLRNVDLSYNNFQSRLPLFSSASLEMILLGHNQFTGRVYTEQSQQLQSSSLRVFEAQYNQLQGTLPLFLSRTTQLIQLDLSNNRFTGKIPTFLGELTSLVRLYLSNNLLSGTIPHFLANGSLADLQELYLHGNLLTGTLPVGLADLPSIRVLFIDENKITGTVPTELCALSLNELFFHGSNAPDVDSTYNDLYGDDSGNGRGSNDGRRALQWQRKAQGKEHALTLSSALSSTKVLSTETITSAHRDLQRQGDPTSERDGCTSIACPAGYKSQSGDENAKDGVFPCELCEFETLNPYIGSNRCFEINQESVLQTFYDATNGSSWTGGQDWADSRVTTCAKRGVACNSNGQVTGIVLRDLGLAGTLPPDLGFLSHLEVLDVSHNRIGGRLPPDLRFAPLELLDVAENLITGFVPLSLCQKAGINGNGLDGIFTCDTVACRAGYHSPTGRADPGAEGDKCRLCVVTDDEPDYLGTIECQEPITSDAITPFGLVGEIAIAFFGLAMVLILIWVYRRSAVSSEYIKDRAYELHGPGGEEGSHGRREGGDDFADPNADPEEMDPLGGIDGLGQHSLTNMEVKVKDEWNSGKESTKEVWLDVPKIQ